jgi:hypothetical protein
MSKPSEKKDHFRKHWWRTIEEIDFILGAWKAYKDYKEFHPEEKLPPFILGNLIPKRKSDL